ncbi:MAG: rod shape-determining protein RodA [Candidatus Tectomicrobia bacterium]|uniref:Peptidoglycan glycosyltransferase RodA n=1 Tax=Tectimicrobiota bacterium TaxID=2528274 RepID=A0A932I3Y1_UNCTE|nr:rod shape-determining protein RodA [Candidatus Tectomicrobia bacterium]
MRTSAPILKTLSPFRRALGQVDWLLVGATVSLSGIGVLMIYSAIHSNQDLLANGLHWKQALWSTIGLLVLSFVLLFDYHHFTRMAYFFYGLVIVLLVMVLFAGRVVYGAKRWLVFGPMRLQPSEVARLAVIIILARIFGARDSSEPLRLGELIYPFILVMIPVVLIAKQPDLGTAFTVFMTAAVLALMVGVERRILYILGAGAVVMAPVGWFFLKEYQRNRILTLFNPEADPLGTGYQSLQSKIAIGSGEFWGKGLLQGTQSRLHFLPEKHTDFIFSVLSEELGFVGGIFLLVVFLVFIHRCMLAALNAGDKEGALIATGVATSFFFYSAFNIGMTLGLIPIVGIPLPLVSYGGSASLTSFIAVALVINVRMRRKGFNSF